MKYWILYIFSALMVAAFFFRPENNMPVVEVSVGQVLYSVNVATAAAVVTGYGLLVQERHGDSAMEIIGGGTDAPVVSSTITEVEKEKPKRVVATRHRRAPEKPATAKEVKREPPEEALNPYIIARMIRTIDETQYFREIVEERSRVNIELLSLTPRRERNDYLLAFRVVNNTDTHFIPRTVSVRHGAQVARTQVFLDHIISAGRTADGYIWVREKLPTAARQFNLIESGGRNRRFRISF